VTAVSAGGNGLPSALKALASWSAWVPFAEACDSAPKEPGVYLAREGSSKVLVYVGMAGERSGGNGRPKGLRGRLAVYRSGKALASGLGEAVFDRALADPKWLKARVAEVESGRPCRAKQWGQAAFERADLEVCWATVANRAEARELEMKVLRTLVESDIWNRSR